MRRQIGLHLRFAQRLVRSGTTQGGGAWLGADGRLLPLFFMFRKRIRVELTTPRGRFFRGVASSIELRTVEGLISVTPWEKSYLSMSHTTEITLRTGNEFRAFVLENATAKLAAGRLTVLAEEIHPGEAAIPRMDVPQI